MHVFTASVVPEFELDGKSCYEGETIAFHIDATEVQKNRVVLLRASRKVQQSPLKLINSVAAVLMLKKMRGGDLGPLILTARKKLLRPLHFTTQFHSFTTFPGAAQI